MENGKAHKATEEDFEVQEAGTDSSGKEAPTANIGIVGTVANLPIARHKNTDDPFWSELAEAADKAEGQWVEYVGPSKPASSVAAINRGQYAAMPKGLYKAAFRNGRTFVRNNV